MSEALFRREIPRVRTVVVKTGSRIITAEGSDARISRLAADIAALRAGGVRAVLVSSGAIAHGMRALAMTKRPGTIPLQQACASIGQSLLMDRFRQHFTAAGLLTGQVLLTWDDLRSKKRYLNLRNPYFHLFTLGVIPIVNENDSVGVEEIRFGTNDILGAQIALLVQADIFVNLTDVGGLFDRNPHLDPSARHLPVVARLSETLLRSAVDRKTEISVGGMASKLKAAEIVTRSGIFSLVGDGLNRSLRDVLTDPSCATLFLPSQGRMSSRRRWIAFSGAPQGTITVDEGARAALQDRGKSLLAAGVRVVTGAFSAGDSVDLKTADGPVFARGLVNYSAEELRRIKGCRSSEIAAHLGRREFDEVIHRDNLAIF